jgi:D-alanyl-D-alanine carboxypeptidase/D-alanyl-D-alanine-endopeptidase (penicillin-binding protein 4)
LPRLTVHHVHAGRLCSHDLYEDLQTGRYQKMRKPVWLPLLVALLVTTTPHSIPAATHIKDHVVHGGYLMAGSRNALRHNADKSFIPASTIKILTSLIGLEILGPDFRFETHFFLDAENNLYIKGFGDPSLTSEAVLAASGKIAAEGIDKVNRILLDDTFFSLPEEPSWHGSSHNPYDAPNGSLAVNFNTLPFEISDEGRISSGERQTPVLPLMIKAAGGLKAGKYRYNINVLGSAGGLPAPLRYVGELFVKQLSRAGIVTGSGFERGVVPARLKPFYIHRSNRLTEITRDCLKYSSNFVANQIFLSYGAARFGPPATWTKSRQATALYLHSLPNAPRLPLKIVEGSGLSRENRLSPADLCTILHHFKPYASILEKRGSLLLKSGTLSDVFCYAGYRTSGNALYPFAIMLNQRENRRDELLEQLLGRITAAEKGTLQ